MKSSDTKPGNRTDICVRCKNPAESVTQNEHTSFWGSIRRETQTVERRTVRVAGTSYRFRPHELVVVDDEKRLCAPCWGLLVGHFLHGRAVDAVQL